MIETFFAELPHGIRLSCRAAGPKDAPVLMVNNKRMCGFMSNEKIDKLVEELK